MYATIVTPGGKILKTYPGYNAATLKELSASIARLAGIPERPLPLDGAPEKLVVGCPLQRTETAASGTPAK